MARISVIGGTGYAGTNIVREAASRGHEVVATARHRPADAVEGVTYIEGDALDPAVLAEAVDGADVVISAVAPRGPLAGHMRELVEPLVAAVRRSGARLGVVGGAGSLLVAPGGPKLLDTPEFPAEFADEAREMSDILDDLRGTDEGLDWFYVSPAAAFGAWAPGEHTGVFRVGGDVLLSDENGASEISGADLAHAIVDEIDHPTHRRARFGVAY